MYRLYLRTLNNVSENRLNREMPSNSFVHMTSIPTWSLRGIDSLYYSIFKRSIPVLACTKQLRLCCFLMVLLNLFLYSWSLTHSFHPFYSIFTHSLLSLIHSQFPLHQTSLNNQEDLLTWPLYINLLIKTGEECILSPPCL